MSVKTLEKLMEMIENCLIIEQDSNYGLFNS